MTENLKNFANFFFFTIAASRTSPTRQPCTETPLPLADMYRLFLCLTTTGWWRSWLARKSHSLAELSWCREFEPLSPQITSDDDLALVTTWVVTLICPYHRWLSTNWARFLFLFFFAVLIDFFFCCPNRFFFSAKRPSNMCCGNRFFFGKATTTNLATGAVFFEENLDLLYELKLWIKRKKSTCGDKIASGHCG